MPDLHNKRFRLTSDGRLEVYDAKLATAVNRLLKTYDNGKYRFIEGEEGLFKTAHLKYTGTLYRLLGIKTGAS